ncbi:hypothetical protein RFI_03872 [Reticulomyxa filosa]|uniref:Rab-GAP TBC domain-containing protein n=1 Tax=Reticulomyxa filosa TaxID=46433 RepID=X6P3V9_RETFI|nr:hypothetical protein RFI_03872 [Reticulomyxa filosa]|eukprot:ETO33235.1 hypothetical protein RFI_03872 [Reticulomyxa filosa]
MCITLGEKKNASRNSMVSAISTLYLWTHVLTQQKTSRLPVSAKNQQNKPCQTFVLKINNQKEFLSTDVSHDESEELLQKRILDWLISNNKLSTFKNQICQYFLKNEKVRQINNGCFQVGGDPSVDITAKNKQISVFESINAAKKEWDTRLRDQLCTLCQQENRPLIVKDSTTKTDLEGDETENDESNDGSQCNENNCDESIKEMSTKNAKPIQYLRYVYTSEDVLDALANIASSNTGTAATGWGLIKLDLRTSNLQELRRRFKELHPRNKHLGADNELHFNEGGSIFCKKNFYFLKIFIRLFNFLKKNFSKKKSSSNKEKNIWKLHILYNYENTANSVDEWDIITDRLYRLDVEHALDHYDYFPFEDFLNDLILTFSRDPLVPFKTSIPVSNTPLPSTFLPSEQKDSSTLTLLTIHDPESPCTFKKIFLAADENICLHNNNNDNAADSIEQWLSVIREKIMSPKFVPPCHVIPFHQQKKMTLNLIKKIGVCLFLVYFLQILLATPLCYLFPQCKDAYFFFRELYCRYFCRLSCISSEKDSIIYLSKSFETLAQYCYPKAFYHCVEIGVHPLSIVFPWIFVAFSGYLQINETLYLWDRILSYDSLELLSILSAAIFGFRQKDILKATNEQQIYVLFADIRGLKVIPILQHFLFSNH